MGMKKIHRHLAAWIACMAMLFAALAPAISQAAAAAHDDVWSQICSASGTRMVKMQMADDASSDAGKQMAGHTDHCPFCATHAGSFALPPSAGVALPLVAPLPSFPFLFFQAPQPLAIWTVAQSRAPPFSS